MILREDIIEIGIYNKTHGINGEINASFEYDIDDIKNIECFISNINGIFVPFFAETIRAKSKDSVLLKIEGLDNENSVKMLVNSKIYALKSVFKHSQEITEDTEELPLDFFIGFTIYEENDNKLIGEIIDVDYSTENLLFIVKHQNEQIFIPATDDFIIDIDIENKSLLMNLPIGILDI